jgi:hypothetical protein
VGDVASGVAGDTEERGQTHLMLLVKDNDKRTTTKTRRRIPVATGRTATTWRSQGKMIQSLLGGGDKEMKPTMALKARSILKKCTLNNIIDPHPSPHKLRDSTYFSPPRSSKWANLQGRSATSLDYRIRMPKMLATTRHGATVTAPRVLTRFVFAAVLREHFSSDSGLISQP